MNIKRIFGSLLTLLGIIALIYAAYGFTGGAGNTQTLIIYAVLGAIFFFSGISLIKVTKDEA